MKYQCAVTFLTKHGVSAAGHTSRSLLQHLEGTYDILRRWESTADTCYGGLFHSIYGTNFYLHKCIDLSDRPTVQSIIGKRAEHLAYLYCITDFRVLLHEFAGRVIPSTRPDVAPSSLRIGVSTRLGLIEIALANLLEQVPSMNPDDVTRIRERDRSAWMQLLPSLRKPISLAAYGFIAAAA